MTKYILIKYENIIGEYEINQHYVLPVDDRYKVEEKIHELFLEFWGEATEHDFLDRYEYGDKGIKITSYQEITDEENAFLNRLGI